ncbi:MAG: Mu-like prophage major head subunit gpT family protein [Fimbriimonadales bacterium]
MPLVRSDLLSLVEAGLRTEFFGAYRQLESASIVPQIATIVRTNLPTQKYGWLGTVPVMREFVDERSPSGLRVLEYTISDRTWEASIAVERRALEDEQYDMIRMRVRDLALEAVRHREQLVIQALLQGATTGFTYDGYKLFDTNHQEGESGVQSNVYNGALSTEALQQAIARMMQFKDDRGRPMGIMPDTLLVGPKLHWLAMELLESPIVVQANTTNNSTPYKNVLQGKLRLMVSPYITGADENRWFLLDTSRSVRAVIFQERRDVPLEFSALDSPNSEQVFLRDKAFYGVRARYGVGYGLWHTALMGTG